jgi:hypothetical protein
MVEHVPYTLVGKYPGFEIRDYAEHSLVSVDTRGDSSGASYQGFGALFRYISGDNATGQSIPMTAPVFQEPLEPGQYRVSFAMPGDLGASDIPAPRGAGMTVHLVPRRLVAALRFRGSVDDAKLEEKTRELLDSVARAGLVASGPVLSARYDPPMMPPLFRRNEVMVKIPGGRAMAKLQ